MRIHTLAEATIFDENELKRRDWRSPRELRAWLKDNGFRRLGGGQFGAAYGKPGHKRVVKISTREDKCWLQFSMYAMHHWSENPHLPRIPWVKTYDSDKGERFFVTVLERLEPFTRASVNRINDPAVLLILLKSITDYERHDIDTFDYDVADAIERKLEDLGISGFSDRNLRRLVNEKFRNHPLNKTLRDLTSRRGECFEDIHQGNLMMRGSTVVVTDPLADPTSVQ